MYEIKIDKPKALVEVRLGGLMTLDEVGSYIEELKRLFIAHNLRSYAMVIDVTDCPIQTQDMIQAMGQHMTTMPKARALAIVTGSSLARMQVRRLFKQPYARIVASQAEGLAWVLEGVEPHTP